MKTIWLCVCLAVGLLLTALVAKPPEIVSARSSVQAFSAERTAEDIRHLTRRPHPVGSPEHERIRTYLTNRLATIGLKAETFRSVAVQQKKSGGSVRTAPVFNIVAVMPGRDRSLPALAIMAHYDDAVAWSLGSSDNAAGVASALEIARVLKAGTRPERDVVFVFTDAETIGLLGSETFFRKNPQAKHIGVVLNFDASGGAGRAAMLETGDGDRALVSRFARVVRHPSAMSLTNAIFRRFNDRTDFSVVRQHGLSGLNFVYFGRRSAALPGRIDLRSVQHMGDQALPIARDLAHTAELSAANGDVVYGDLFGTFLIHYSPLCGWFFLIVAAGLTLFAFAAGRASNTFSVACGFFGSFFVVGMGALAMWPIGRIFAGFNIEQRMPQSAYILAAALCLAFSVVFYAIYALRTGSGRRVLSVVAILSAGLSCLAGFDPFAILMALGLIVSSWFIIGKPIASTDLWRGSLLFGFVLSLGFQTFCPDMTPLVLWPLLIAGISAGLVFSTFSGRHDHVVALGICGVCAICVLIQIGGQGLFMFDFLGLEYPAILVVPLIALLPVLMPLVAAAGDERSLPELGFLLLVAGVGLGGFARFATSSPERPEPVEISYFRNFNTGRSYLVSTSRRLDGWSRSVLTSGGEPVRRLSEVGVFPGSVWAAGYASSDMPHPNLSVVRENGRITVTAKPTGVSSRLTLAVYASTALSGVRLSGRALRGGIPPRKWVCADVYAVDAAGAVWSFAVPAHGKVDVRLAEHTRLWPQGAMPLPSLPANKVRMRGFGSSIGLIERRIAW